MRILRTRRCPQNESGAHVSLQMPECGVSSIDGDDQLFGETLTGVGEFAPNPLGLFGCEAANLHIEHH